MVRRVCVLGAGIIGMSTATVIQERILDVEVTVTAAEFSPNTTSDIAAGLIEPYLCGNDVKTIKRWCHETMQYIREYMVAVPNGGAQEVSGYRFTQKTEVPFWASLMDNFRVLSENEIKKRHPKPYKTGFFYTTLYLQPTTYLDYITKKFIKAGGRLVQQHLKTVTDVGCEYDVIVNCTGLGSNQLLGDENVRPIRGQIIRARCPAVKHFFADDDNYVLLNDNCLILGGTAELDEWDVTVDEKTAQKILQDNIKNVPALKDAEILSHHVGLRPNRTNILLKTAYITIGNKKVPIVNNYGHGGSGVTLFWGCALDALKLVKKEIRSNSSIAKL